MNTYFDLENKVFHPIFVMETHFSSMSRFAGCWPIQTRPEQSMYARAASMYAQLRTLWQSGSTTSSSSPFVSTHNARRWNNKWRGELSGDRSSYAHARSESTIHNCQSMFTWPITRAPLFQKTNNGSASIANAVYVCYSESTVSSSKNKKIVHAIFFFIVGYF